MGPGTRAGKRRLDLCARDPMDHQSNKVSSRVTVDVTTNPINPNHPTTLPGTQNRQPKIKHRPDLHCHSNNDLSFTNGYTPPCSIDHSNGIMAKTVRTRVDEVPHSAPIIHAPIESPCLEGGRGVLHVVSTNGVIVQRKVCQGKHLDKVCEHLRCMRVHHDNFWAHDNRKKKKKKKKEGICTQPCQRL